MIWLLTRSDTPPSSTEVAAQVGLTSGWVRTILKRWNAQGPEGLVDRRGTTNGGQHKLTTDQQVDLWAALQQPPPDGGLWTGPKVATSVHERWGVVVCKQTGWQWLKDLGFSLQVPRPQHPEAATPADQRAWKRGLGRSASRTASAGPRRAGGVVG